MKKLSAGFVFLSIFALLYRKVGIILILKQLKVFFYESI